MGSGRGEDNITPRIMGLHVRGILNMHEAMIKKLSLVEHIKVETLELAVHKDDVRGGRGKLYVARVRSGR
jgi:hypothetical protein